MSKRPYIKIVGPARSMSTKRQIIGVKINEFQVFGRVTDGVQHTNLKDEAVYFHVVDLNQGRKKYLPAFIDFDVDVEVSGYYTENKVIDEHGEETVVHVIEAKYIRVLE